VRAQPLSAPLAAAWLDGPACSGRAAHQGEAEPTGGQQAATTSKDLLPAAAAAAAARA
jgi:hypothetical protein